ncbi:MAG: reverse transcriptase/maturase family protein [Solirubrobacteraceae bacterium]
MRPLSIPAVRDRVVQAAARIVIEPIFEADFLPCSFGFRPRRGQHDALETIRTTVNQGNVWVLDADIKACLEASSHCQCVHGGGVEQRCFGLWDLYS